MAPANSHYSCVFEIPDWGVKPNAAGDELPFVLWPICGKSLLERWLDWGWSNVEGSIILTSSLINNSLSAFLKTYPHYSIRIEVMDLEDITKWGTLPRKSYNDFPYGEYLVNVSDKDNLYKLWFELNGKVFHDLSDKDLPLSTQLHPGVWIGINSVISPKTKLIPPCFIGTGTIIEQNCTIGPNAFISSNCFIESDVSGSDFIVTRSTFVGAHLSLSQKIISGSLIVGIESGDTTRVSDIFIVHAIGTKWLLISFCRFLFFSLLFLMALVPALLWNLGSFYKEPIFSEEDGLAYKKLQKGPPLFRHIFALPLIASGKMKCLGRRPFESVLRDAHPFEHSHVPSLFPHAGRKQHTSLLRFLHTVAYLLGILR